MPRSGEIGEQIFEQVEKLVAGGMNRTEAFAKISSDTGRRAGTGSVACRHSIGVPSTVSRW